ncbi:hypothetical protein SLA2020_403200 [Shorea laevis]
MSWRRNEAVGRRGLCSSGCVGSSVDGGGGCRSWVCRWWWGRFVGSSAGVDGVCWISGWWWFVRGVRRALPLVVGAVVGSRWKGIEGRDGFGGKADFREWGKLLG